MENPSAKGSSSPQKLRLAVEDGSDARSILQKIPASISASCSSRKETRSKPE